MSLEREYAASDLIVLRTPLLPFDAVEAWSSGTTDREVLRERLARVVMRPDVREALFVASPDLVASIDNWMRNPRSKKGQRTELGLVRYFLRMATRPTPFGLFSGCTAGSSGGTTRLAFAGKDDYRRHTRLDMDYLFALCESLTRSHDLRAEIRFRPNASLYETAGRLRYAEARVNGRHRTYHLVAVDTFDALQLALDRAAKGATLEELALALVESDAEGEITYDDAAAFVHDLIDNQLLLPELSLPVTGEESTHGLARQLASTRSMRGAAAQLARTDAALDALDARGVGCETNAYLDIARELEPLGVPVELSRLFQLDLFKPAVDVGLSDAVIQEILRGVEWMHRPVAQRRFDPMLEDFRRSFRDRYGEGNEVPLLAVLDEETGIGFDRSGMAGADASPVLAGLPFSGKTTPSIAWMPSDATLIRLLSDAIANSRMEIELTDEDWKYLENRERPPMPDAFHAVVTLAAPSIEAIERGDYRILLHSTTGPSGARMFGRFCHADERICSGVKAHLAAEEALAPDAIFAELVHLPAGRMGNILARPVLRQWEIPFLGKSGAPEERQLAVSDLVVTVIGDRIRLRSLTHDREVIPRLTTAHNTTFESLGVYRFLAAMQQALGIEWNWGPLEAAPFLPRVTCGRVVFSRARWRMRERDIKPLAAASGDARFALAREWRANHRMPRYVALADGDNELLLDFENPINVDAVMELFKTREEAVLHEVFPAPDELCAAGAEGRFVHELIVPFVRKAAVAAKPFVTKSVPLPPRARIFAPGSEWLFAKLYLGSGSADVVLRDELAPLAHDLVASGAARSWFFIRFGDPAWHLRVRFRGERAALRDAVLPKLEALFERLQASGTAWKFQLDTYEREIERYGGPEGIELCEELFFFDSEAVVSMLETFTSDAGADIRWRTILLGMDRLLEDFGYGLASKIELAERARDGFARNYRYDPLRTKIADRLRNDRAALLRLLAEPPPAPLRRRSESNAPVIHELRTRESRGHLQTAIASILPSLIHMFVNRATRSAGPEHELVLYDYLVQLYRSQMAKEKKGREIGIAV